MNAVKLIDDVAGRKKSIISPADYLDEEGLLVCGKCNTRKQYAFEFLGEYRVVNSMCACEKARYEADMSERKLQGEKAAISRMKAVGIHDKTLMDCTFDKDDGTVPQIKAAKRYVETWQDRKTNNEGLLLWGDVGTGKTFFAACIANALIEEGVPVLMTNFAKILNKLSGMYSEDKNEFISSLMRYQLLIIDDLGIERNTEYAVEQVYNIIDERYKTNKPLIVTTNLSLNTLKNPEDTAHKRIYDRVLAMCVPIKFEGESHRKKEMADKFYKCKQDLFS